MSHFLLSAITKFVYLRPFTGIQLVLFSLQRCFERNRCKKLIYNAFKIPQN